MIDAIREVLEEDGLLDDELISSIEEYNELPMSAAQIIIECELDGRNRSMVRYQRVQETIEDSTAFGVAKGKIPCRGEDPRQAGYIVVAKSPQSDSVSDETTADD